MDVFWLGTRRGLEAEVVPQAGFQIYFISIGGLRGKRITTLLLAPFKLAMALMQSFMVLMRLRPDLVLGMGGFVTGPGGIMAWMLRRPLIIHEQNAVAGLTNRLLSRFATLVVQAFPNTFPDKSNVITLGNPVRPEIAKLPPPEERYPKREGPLRLLVLGGSLGAVSLNKTVPAGIGFMPRQHRPQVLHQTGKGNRQAALEYYESVHMQANVVPFIRQMEEAYEWADLVVCRAGALTIAELAAAGVASILVPYPHAVDDHQTVNAKYLADAGAALLVPQDRLTPEYLSDLLISFAGENMTPVRERLLKMAMAARQLAQVNATDDVANMCLKLARSGAGQQSGVKQ